MENSPTPTLTARCMLWKNLTNPFETTHIGTDGFCNVWEEDLPLHDDIGSHGFEALTEEVFYIHNMDDRPTGQVCPSASVGDVVSVEVPGEGTVWFACASFGWQKIGCPDGGPANRPRIALGAAYFARSRDEYVQAETQALNEAQALRFPYNERLVRQ